MTMTARLDLSVWRNDDTYEFPLRVIGLDLTGKPMRAQIRVSADTPGAALVSLELVTNANAQGIRLAGVTTIAGVVTSDVRIRINKSTRVALPYAGEIGDAAVLVWAFQIAGRTRLVGDVRILAHAIDSDAAPASRMAGPGAERAAYPAGAATLTITSEDVVTLAIDGTDVAAGFADTATEAARRAEDAAQASLATSRYFATRAAGEAGSTAGQLFATSDGAGQIIFWQRTGAGSIEVGRAVTTTSLAGGPIALTGDLTLDDFDPRSADGYVLNGHTLTIVRMADTPRTGLFTGAGTVIIRSGFARPEWWTAQPLRRAADAVSRGGGGIVLCDGRYLPEFTSAAPMTSSNVIFRGSGRPRVANGFANLDGGTIFVGPFVIDAANVAVEDAGVDSGAAVCAALYGGTAQEGLIAPNAGQVIGAALRPGIRFSRVEVLCRDATAGVHAILVEIASGALVEQCGTTYGGVGVVLKARKSTVRGCRMRGHGVAPGLDKSDAYSQSLDNQWEDCQATSIAGADTGPFRIQAESASSARHTFRDMRVDGTTQWLSIETSGASNASDISVLGGSSEGTRFGGITISRTDTGSGRVARVTIASPRINNVQELVSGADYIGNGIYLGENVDTVNVTGAQIYGTAGDGIHSKADGVLVTGSTALAPGQVVTDPVTTRYGYRTVAGSMKVPASGNIGTSSASVATA